MLRLAADQADQGSWLGRDFALILAFPAALHAVSCLEIAIVDAH